MFRVERPSVVPDVGPVASRLLVLLAGLVAVPAQGLQLAQPERIPVTFMRDDVVGDHALNDEALLQAMGAERMGLYLKAGSVFPTSQAVPVSRVGRMQHLELHLVGVGWLLESGVRMSDADDAHERELRIDLMAIQIERLRQEIKMENRKFAVQLIVAAAALLGVGVAIGRFWLFHG